MDDYQWLELPAVNESVEKFRLFITDYLSQKVNPERLNEIELAAEEAIMNIIKHGQAKYSQTIISIGCLLDEQNQFHLLVQDNGKPFDTTKLQVKPIRSSLEEAEKQGFGCLLIRQLTDNLSFISENQKNTLHMTFNLEKVS